MESLIDNTFSPETNDVDEIRKKIDQIRRNLKNIISQSQEEYNLEGSKEFIKVVTETNKILSRIRFNNNTDVEALESKSSDFYLSGKLISEVARKYQEFYSEKLLQQITLISNQLEGFGKRLEISALVKKPIQLSLQDLIKLYSLFAEFIENYSQTHLGTVSKFMGYGFYLSTDAGLLHIEDVASELKLNAQEFLSLKQAVERFSESTLLAPKENEFEKEEKSASTETFSFQEKLNDYQDWNREEQIQKNRLAIQRLKERIERNQNMSDEEAKQRNNFLENFKTLMDVERPVENKHYSE